MVYDDGAGSALYAAGAFFQAGGTPANRIAKWNGSTWLPLGNGFGGVPSPSAHALAVFDDGSGPALYAGGNFTSAGQISAARIARWDGTQWSSLGSGTSNVVHALAVFDDGTGSGERLYVGGAFATAGGLSVGRIARWDGAAWSSVAGGVNSPVHALVVHDDGSGGGAVLYAGGQFTVAGGEIAQRVARWDGAAWSAVGTGLSEDVTELAVIDDGNGPALYAAGQVLAKWDGVAWDSINPGTNGQVHALAEFSSGRGKGRVLMAGNFTSAGNVNPSNIVHWDGHMWATLVGKFNNRIEALAVYDDGSGSGPALFAGGWFTIAGGQSANYIAKWDGATWSPLGSGTNGWVYAMTVFHDGSGSGPALYVGGTFTMAGDVNAYRIARWDGKQWSALGVGMHGGTTPSVRALTVFDDALGNGPALYAGGGFTTAGAMAVNRIARWNGREWSALGAGIEHSTFQASINALHVFQDSADTASALYVGGFFDTAGSAPADSIARWDGQGWSPLGSGIDYTVHALATYSDDASCEQVLIAGGLFESAGGTPASNIARWDGEAWSALGGGVDDAVYALQMFDDGFGNGPALYAGGNFSNAGGQQAANIARWDGASWSSVASGLASGGQVLALLSSSGASGNSLYVGGLLSVIPTGDVHLARLQGCHLQRPLSGDLNCDGFVDVSDLLILLSAWGECPPARDCPADLTGDGVVDVSDLLVLLARWS